MTASPVPDADPRRAEDDPLAAYDFALPAECIAQHPLPERDAARLLVLTRSSGAFEHRHVRDLPELLAPGDLLVANATRVLPARLRGRKASGGAAEVLLIGAGSRPGAHRALLRCGGRQREGLVLHLGDDGRLVARVVGVGEGGEVELHFDGDADPYPSGEMPLPPYIHRPAPEAGDRDRYQTVFAREPGAVAAPTAGLHLTQHLLHRLAERGIGFAEVVLHVGAGTFRPLRDQDLARGELHPERYELPGATAQAVARTRAAGGRVVAVGTTTTRVLEACTNEQGELMPGRGETRLFQPWQNRGLEGRLDLPLAQSAHVG